jgi:hypothetical protein
MNAGVKVPVEALPAIAVMPSCFGVPFARDASSSECQSCRVQRHCDGVIASVASFMEKKCGTLSPEADRRLLNTRTNGSERQRRFRARKKEALAASNRSA